MGVFEVSPGVLEEAAGAVGVSASVGLPARGVDAGAAALTPAAGACEAFSASADRILANASEVSADWVVAVRQAAAAYRLVDQAAAARYGERG